MTYGYGLTEGFVLALSAEVYVEHYPPGGPWLMFCPSERQSGLNHFLYNSPEIQSLMAGWIKSPQSLDQFSRVIR
jgi:hypothetical protein